MRVLKECKLVKRFIDYTYTEQYKNFSRYYVTRHTDCSELWYDRELCADILGCCNFEHYLSSFGEPKYDVYTLVLAYLAIFDVKEYIKYMDRNNKAILSHEPPKFLIRKIMHGTYHATSIHDSRLVEKWVKIKNYKYEN